MKILFHAPRFHTNQFESVRVLKEKGHEVEFHVSAIGATEDHRLLVPKLYKPTKISLLIESLIGQTGDKRYLFPKPVLYYKELEKSKADVIIIRNPQRIFSLFAVIFSKMLGIKVIFYTQTALHKKYSILRRLATSLLLRLFDAAWITPLIGQPNEHPFHPKHMYYVPFSVPRWKKVPCHCNEPIRILTIGKMVPRKNHDLLIKSLSMLRSIYKFELTIVGECVGEKQEAYRDKIVELISDLGLEECVKLFTNVEYKEISGFYGSHDIFILPASNEPASISVLEASANGLPTICSTTCGTRFYIEDGANGYVFKSSDLKDLTEKIGKLLVLGLNLIAMKEKAIERGTETVSEEVYYELFSDVFLKRWGVELS